MTHIISTEAAQKGFYPTPDDVAEKMLEGIDLRRVSTVLEPSAGKGNLIHALGKAAVGVNEHLTVDAVEIDPNLRAILEHTYGGALHDSIRTQMGNIRHASLKRGTSLTDEERKALDQLNALSNLLDAINEFYVVHDNFLVFETRKRYDLILMNPPFEDGDKHLMKAITLLADGGQLRCLLNAETVLNPYSLHRQELTKALAEMDAEIVDMGSCFTDAERETGVSVVMIKAQKPATEYTSRIWDELERAKSVDVDPDDVHDLTAADLITNRISQFNLECDAGLALIREYMGMKPYLMQGTGKYDKPSISLSIGGKDDILPNRFLRLTRLKYWKELLANPQFMSRMTSEIRNDYSSKVDEMANYDFSAYNIRRVMLDIQKQLLSGVEDSIMKLFETLSVTHAWYPECEANIHYYNGWATNKAHAVNRKVIIPCHGVFRQWGPSKGSLYAYEAYELLADLEKALDYLTASPGDESNFLERRLNQAESDGVTKNIDLRYFKVTFYKKGTCHITFHEQEVVDKLNIFCARHKNWLPPCYGKKAYSDMDAKEKAVVDGLNGDGSEGSGAKMYAKVLAKPEYYLAEPSDGQDALPLLGAAV